MKNPFKVILPPSQSKNVIVTHAIGFDYLKKWEENSRYTWELYCKKHELGLIVLTETIDDDGKKYHWQKLLIPKELIKYYDINNFCYLDTDIVISPLAPNIFDIHNSRKIGIISQFKNLPYNRLATLKRCAFFRHTFYNKEYPLDSSLFFSAKQQFKYHGLKGHDDYACAGVFVGNCIYHGEFFSSIFYKYQGEFKSIDGGGEEVFLNHHLLESEYVQWLPYKWQALWIFEMPWCHSHLYENDNKQSIVNSITTSLYNSYFLHFAGSWEGIHWNECKHLKDHLNVETFNAFETYNKMKLTKRPKGLIKR